MLSLLAAGLVLGACSEDGSGPGSGGSALVTILQAAGRATRVQATINGRTYTLQGSGQRALARLGPGTYAFSLAVLGSGVVGSSGTLDLEAGGRYLLIAQDSQGVIVGSVVADTGAIVPSGKSKLRVIHAAGLAPPIDVYRTQPDFPTLITVMFPFNFGSASPYLQSDPGIWTIVVTPDDQTDTLYSSGPIAAGDGGRVTVVLVDSSAVGGISAEILVEEPLTAPVTP